ncbi:hypothetical protein [Isoptericola sp. NPDC056134]|uniref:hypothetical protein n=1 Tax=Isoptericola sp. NPDC056134 TaxID=3345723 RepID=UPI0035E52BC3
MTPTRPQTGTGSTVATPSPPAPATRLLVVVATTALSLPFVYYVFVVAALSTGVGGAGLLLLAVPVGLASWVCRAVMRSASPSAGGVGGLAPVVATVAWAVHSLAPSLFAPAPPVLVGAVAALLAGAVAALALPRAWRLAGVLVLVVLGVAGWLSHRAAEQASWQEAQAALTRPYVLDVPYLEPYDVVVGEENSSATYSAPGISVTVLTYPPGSIALPPEVSPCDVHSTAPEVPGVDVRCAVPGVPEGWLVVVESRPAPDADVAALAATAVPMPDDAFQRWAG